MLLLDDNLEELTENENENEKDEKDEKKTPLTIFIKIS